jgi:endoglucanase
LVFTGDEFADGGSFIAEVLKREKIKSSFFLTGRFHLNAEFRSTLKRLKKDGHYLGAHSNEHLLYCDWQKRDSLLVTEQQFKTDLADNYAEMRKYGVAKKQAAYFLPPYEWYNDTIAAWTKESGLQLINFTPGTKSTADYTTPDMKNYHSSEEIYQSIIKYEQLEPSGLNGFILLIHIGADPKRTDKFYHRLPQLIKYLQAKGYQFQTVDQLLKPD